MSRDHSRTNGGCPGPVHRARDRGWERHRGLGESCPTAYLSADHAVTFAHALTRPRPLARHVHQEAMFARAVGGGPDDLAGVVDPRGHGRSGSARVVEGDEPISTGPGRPAPQGEHHDGDMLTLRETSPLAPDAVRGHATHPRSPTPAWRGGERSGRIVTVMCRTDGPSAT